MFLQLRHKKSVLYSLSKKIVYDCHHLHQHIHSDNKNGIAEQVTKAALIAHLDITKGLYCNNKKKARKHFKVALKAYLVLDAGAAREEIAAAIRERLRPLLSAPAGTLVP